MSQPKIKFIKSLSQQKYRKAYNSYLVEGSKIANEWLLSSEEISLVAALPEWLDAHKPYLSKHTEAEILPLKEQDLQKASALKTAQSVIMVVKQKHPIDLPKKLSNWTLYLEEIRDPGNMGTILRIADWFGISYVLYSEQCVEIYNPKVVQASMGSLLRVKTKQVSREELFALASKEHYPLYATSLDGKDILRAGIEKWIPGILALGNESLGLSDAVLEQAHYHLKIEGRGDAESLNVGVAAGIFCALLTM